MIKSLITYCLIGIALGGSASADNRQRESRINTTTPVSTNYYAGGSTVTVDTQLQQDARIMGSTINIGGSTNQDMTLFGDAIMIRGNVGGDLRVLGNTVQLYGSISGDVVIVGSTIEIGNTVSIGGNVKLYASTIIYNGQTQGTLSLNSNHLIYHGVANNGATIIAQSIDTQSGSRIQGNLQYRTSQKNPTLESLVINGKAQYEPTLQQYSMIGQQYQWISGYMVFWLCFVIIMSMIVYSSCYHLITPVSRTLSKDWMSSFLSGCAVICSMPLIAVALSITIIGIPIAVILVMMYITMLITYQILVVTVLTQLIKQHYFPTTSFKDQFATICTLISLGGVITIMGWFSAIPGLFVIGALRQSFFVRK